LARARVKINELNKGRFALELWRNPGVSYGAFTVQRTNPLGSNTVIIAKNISGKQELPPRKNIASVKQLVFQRLAQLPQHKNQKDSFNSL